MTNLHNRCDISSKYYDDHIAQNYLYYYVNDQNHLHCEDGPALETIRGIAKYYYDGFLHRLDGPAYIQYGREYYYVHGFSYTKETYYQLDKVIEFTKKSNSKNSIKESNCKQCSKKNDFGVKSCWWCGILDPVGL